MNQEQIYTIEFERRALRDQLAVLKPAKKLILEHPDIPQTVKDPFNKAIAAYLERYNRNLKHLKRRYPREYAYVKNRENR